MTQVTINGHEYATQNGVITSPGKFEGEPVYVPYFWDMILDGFGGIINVAGRQVDYLDLDDTDIERFPTLKGYQRIELHTSDLGFVYHELIPDAVEDPDNILGEAQRKGFPSVSDYLLSLS